MWNRSRDTLVEGNLFLNVQYGIALGLDPGRSDDHAGGIVRNNIFHRGPAQSGDVGIVINNSARTRVLHNTVVLSDTYPNAIEYRFPATTGIEIRYNLSDGAVQRRDGASGTVAGNVTNTQLGWFVDAAGGDLHLAASATPAIAAASRGEQRLRPGDPSHRSAARRRRRRAGRESRPSGKPERPAGAVTRGLPIQGI
jgi:hypothetical protein